MSSELFFVKENAIGAQVDFHALLEIYVADASDETQRSTVQICNTIYSEISLHQQFIEVFLPFYAFNLPISLRFST